MKRDDESSDDLAPRLEPNGDANCDTVALLSINTRAAAASPQSATSLVELDPSLPTAIDDAVVVAAESLVPVRRPQRAGGCHGSNKSYHDIVPTQVYTLPHREGTPVRLLPMPLRLSTAGQQQLLRHHRACAVGVKSQSARCGTHPSRAQARTSNRSNSQAGRCYDVGFRIALVPPATQQQQQQQQQLDDDPSATNTSSSSKKAGQLSVTPYHPNRIRIGDVRSATQNHHQQQQKQQQPDDPSAMSTRSSKKAGQIFSVNSITSHHPTKTRIIGGVHSKNDPCGYRPPKPPLTARSSARQRRRPATFLAVQTPDFFLAMQVQARETTRRWKVAAPRPPLKPRPLSAPARGRAIRRAVDRYCHDLPATSELSYGGTRFLRQWDGASRRQRGQILKALADQLLVGPSGQIGDLYDGKQLGGGQGGGSYDDEQQQQLSVPVDAQSSNEVIKKRTEGAMREPPSGQQIIKLKSAGTPFAEFTISSPACSVLGDNSSGTAPNNVFDSTSTKKVRPRHFCWGYEGGATARPGGGTIETADDYANGTGFLELLGAHTGLLVARISSYLRTLHSSGHATGVCLRVTTLLAESTFEAARGGGRGEIKGSGNSGGGGGGDIGSCNHSNTTSQAQQLSTPGIIRVALETVALETVALETTVVSKPASTRASKPEAKPEPKPGAKLDAKLAYKRLVFEPEAKPASKPDAKPAAVVELVMTLKGARTRTPSSPREEENNRAQALRLLLALVRAGGRRIKEHLTCSSSSIPGADKSGDALGPILVALRRFGCSLETRKTAGKLLVELGVGNPAGSGRVWNAVLSVLGKEKCREAQVLGCDVSRELLLSTLGADCSSSSSSSSNSGISDILPGFVWNQEHQLRPEVLLVPSVLTLSLSDCSATREAVEELATFLVNFSGPCCYLLVAGLVGLLGNISRVNHSAPLYSRRRHPHSSRCEPTTKPRDKKELELRSTGTTKSRDEGKLEIRWSKLHQPTHRRVAEIVGPGNSTYRLNEAGFFCEVHSERPDGPNNSQQGDTDSVVDDGNEIAGGGRGGSGRSAASEKDKFLDGKPARSVSGSSDIDNHVIRAMEVLRKFCSGRGGADVCLALLSTLAPLAVLNLVVGPEQQTAELPPDNEKNDRFAEDATGESTFITQSRTTPDEYAARTAADGCAAFAKQKEEIETEEVRTGATKNCDRRQHEASSHPHRGIEDDFIEDRRAVPDQGKTGPPRQAHFLAVAEALLAMYRLCGGCLFATTTNINQVIRTTENTHRCAPPAPLPLTADLTHGNSTPTPPPFPPDNTGDDFTPGRKGDDKKGVISSEVLELKRMIDAALDGCRTLSSSLRNGDTTALARVLSASADDCHADREEISTLRKNVLALAKRWHGARPPAGGLKNATRQQDELRDAYEEDGGGRRRPSSAGG